ncbi:hypothetical protein [Paenibacillus sp. LHD-38]|uniref:hypothetical protein n=1 Tax=Paenibacillus sp. LHD-38 TaxID=3072143 RepID=UPI00280C5BA0|nr:hypothetical protein [Paenibacillus sp. LHD-38]MDQ8738682.1 hypothetical protein [Paenibacillus sp. LHD-38]
MEYDKENHKKIDNKSYESNACQSRQRIKLLFSHLSKQPRIDLLNGLFHENFTVDNCEIIPGSTEFIDSNLDKSAADYLVHVKQEGETKKFHIEFQTQNHSTMIILMFDYGFKMAKASSVNTSSEGLVFEFPRQLVLYLERDDAILEELSCKIIIRDNDQSIDYKVPVLKYWEIDPVLLRDQLYALLPFQVFGSRKKIKEILDDKGLSDDKKKELIYEELSEVLLTVKRCGEEMLQKLDEKKISFDDMDDMDNMSKTTICMTISNLIMKDLTRRC